MISSLNTDLPSNRIAHDTHSISKICARARELRSQLNSNPCTLTDTETLALIKEMYELDETATSWRVGPSWSYKTIYKRDLAPGTPAKALQGFPERIQLHADAWIAYEWNYHRTARIILHTQILAALSRLLDTVSLASHSYTAPPSQSLAEEESQKEPGLAQLQECYWTSKITISSLANDVLATVPQSLGDIDAAGNVLTGQELGGESVLEEKRSLTGVGAYFLLWPIKIIKSHEHVGEYEREEAKTVFERIREVTGMKAALGSRSCI